MAILEMTERPTGSDLGARSGTLTPVELLALARRLGADPATVERHPAGTVIEERRYQLVALTDDVEVWAIHWPAGGRLELHDHGGSSGALWVVSGTLTERWADHRQLAERTLGAGTGAAFGPDHVHDVVNRGGSIATSVHTYSPPMPGMTYYRLGHAGPVPVRAERRTDPSWAP